jgi:hypothetical protein
MRRAFGSFSFRQPLLINSICLLPFSRGFIRSCHMNQEDELVLKITKEIVIKLIEMGRVSISSFDQVFKQVHTTVYESLMSKSLRIENLE